MTKYDGVPELSLANYHQDETRAEFCEQLFDGLKYYGFIILRDHGIPEIMLDVAYDLTQEFFALDEEEKLTHSYVDMFYQRGYVPFGQEHAKGNIYPDLKEMWHQGREATDMYPRSKDYPKNVYPNKPAGFHEVLNDLYNELDRVGQQVLEALTPSFDVPENYFDELASGGNSLLRALHYPPLADDVDPNCVRSAAHEDINLITLLIAASTAGLELLDRDGTWLPVHGSRNSIVVDAGDMLARITNNVISATTHRVVNPDGDNIARYSIPFFLHPKSDAMLSCIDSCRDGNEQADILADDFLKERLRDIGVAV